MQTCISSQMYRGRIVLQKLFHHRNNNNFLTPHQYAHRAAYYVERQPLHSDSTELLTDWFQRWKSFYLPTLALLHLSAILLAIFKSSDFDTRISISDSALSWFFSLERPHWHRETESERAALVPLAPPAARRGPCLYGASLVIFLTSSSLCYSGPWHHPENPSVAWKLCLWQLLLSVCFTQLPHSMKTKQDGISVHRFSRVCRDFYFRWKKSPSFCRSGTICSTKGAGLPKIRALNITFKTT